MKDITSEAKAYARKIIIPLEAENLQYVPTPYERGMINMLARAFLAGWIHA